MYSLAAIIVLWYNIWYMQAYVPILHSKMVNCLHIQKLLHAESLLTTLRYQMSYFYANIKIQF